MREFNPFLLRHLGIYYMLIASFYNACLGFLAKILSQNLHSFEIVFWRNLIGLFIVLWAIKKDRECDFLRGGHMCLLLFRGFIGVCGMAAFFYNIANAGLSMAFAFYKTAPIFTALIAGFFFAQKLRALSWFAILLGFVGFLLTAQPSGGFALTDIVGIIGGLCSGAALASVHELRKYYKANSIVLSYMIAGTLLMAVLLILGELYPKGSGLLKGVKFSFPNAYEWLLLALVALGGYYFQLYLTRAFAASKKAGIIASISYSDVIFAMIFGLFLGEALPNFIALCGIFVIALSGVLLAKQK